MAEPVLAASGISKAFGALKANEDVSLDVRAQEIHAVIGPNGAGKSTLIAQIAGSLRPDSGSVHLAGRDVTRMPVHRRARLGLGRTFQISSLALELSARGNVMLAVQGSAFGFLRPVRWTRRITGPAEAALTRVGLGARAHVPAGELSHGERRLVEMACALALEPRVLLLDEPMAGLGPEGSAALTDLLADLRAEVPILLVEHDMDAVFRLADRITVLDQGRVLMTGPPDAVRASDEVRRAYLGEEA